MFRVGQRVLTQDLREGRILEILENNKLSVFFEDKTQRLNTSSIYSILRGPQMPDTEDVGYQTYTIEDDSKEKPRHSYYDSGEVVSWTYVVGGAEIEIKGCLLSVRSKSALISEWGASVPQRYWVVPLNKIWKSDPS